MKPAEAAPATEIASSLEATADAAPAVEEAADAAADGAVPTAEVAAVEPETVPEIEAPVMTAVLEVPFPDPDLLER